MVSSYEYVRTTTVVTKKLIIGILLGGALGATVAYYRYRFLEHFKLQAPEPEEAEEEKPFTVDNRAWTGNPRARFQFNPDTGDLEAHHG